MSVGAAVRVWLLVSAGCLTLGTVVRLLWTGVDPLVQALAALAAMAWAAVAWAWRAPVAGEAVPGPRALHAQRQRERRLLGTVVLALAYLGVRQVDGAVDLTTGQRWTPSADSRVTLAQIDVPVRVVAFFANGSAPDQRARLLGEALFDSHPSIRFERSDPIADPLLAESMEMPHPGVVFERDTPQGPRREVLTSRLDETAWVDALVRLTDPTEHLLCWAAGHGEADPDEDRDPRGYGTAVLTLEARTQRVERILPGVQEAPEDCAAWVIAGPTEPWDAAARNALSAYLDRGGAALVLAEPVSADGILDDLRAWGLRTDQGVLLDTAPDRALAGVTDSAFFVVPPAGQAPHPITRAVQGAVVLGTARRIEPVDTEGVQATGLLRTSEQGWSERRPTPPFQADPDEPAGALALAVAAEREDGARLVVIGDATFASNRWWAAGRNANLFLASTQWLLRNSSPEARAPQHAQVLDLTVSAQRLLSLLWLAGLPGLALLGGWWRRRISRRAPPL